MRASIASIGTSGRTVRRGGWRERESLAQPEDQRVDLGEAVRVVQAALELIAEQRAERLAVADPLEHLQRAADPAEVRLIASASGVSGVALAR